MKIAPIARLSLLLVFAVTWGCRGQTVSEWPAAPAELTLAGQLLLPSGFGSRGVEVRVSIQRADDVAGSVWVLFDENGAFSHTFRETLSSIRVTAGIRREMYRIDAGDFPEADPLGQIDLGVIDLRGRLMSHSMGLRAAEGAPPGEVRVAMWGGPPPVGPMGEPVSLGSRQFPPVALGSDIEWLLPRDAHEVFFLVERPIDLGHGLEWRGGQQQLFGPYTSADLPGELVLE